jgi:hypothetical protein
MFTFTALGLGNAFAQLERAMGRFFFDLQGQQNVNDPAGLAFETELDAFRAAQRLAAELSSTRPNLRGNTCVVVIHRRDGDAYYVGV